MTTADPSRKRRRATSLAHGRVSDWGRGPPPGQQRHAACSATVRALPTALFAHSALGTHPRTPPHTTLRTAAPPRTAHSGRCMACGLRATVHSPARGRGVEPANPKRKKGPASRGRPQVHFAWFARLTLPPGDEVRGQGSGLVARPRQHLVAKPTGPEIDKKTSKRIWGLCPEFSRHAMSTSAGGKSAPFDAAAVGARERQRRTCSCLTSGGNFVAPPLSTRQKRQVGGPAVRAASEGLSGFRIAVVGGTGGTAVAWAVQLSAQRRRGRRRWDRYARRVRAEGGARQPLGGPCHSDGQ